MEVHGKLIEKRNPQRWWNICVINGKEVYYRYLGGKNGGEWAMYYTEGGFHSWLKRNCKAYEYIEETPFEGNV